jgi:hypothetical protein
MVHHGALRLRKREHNTRTDEFTLYEDNNAIGKHKMVENQNCSMIIDHARKRKESCAEITRPKTGRARKRTRNTAEVARAAQKPNCRVLERRGKRGRQISPVQTLSVFYFRNAQIVQPSRDEKGHLLRC